MLPGFIRVLREGEVLSGKGYAQGFIRRIFQLSLICHAVCIPYDIRKLILLCLGYAFEFLLHAFSVDSAAVV